MTNLVVVRSKRIENKCFERFSYECIIALFTAMHGTVFNAFKLIRS